LESTKYDEQDAQILAISCNARFTLTKFAESLNDPDFPLLADFWPHGIVGQAYGVFNDERGIHSRSVFIIDRDGVIQWSKVYTPGNLPENEELLAELAKLA
jgi:peroxiredoxin